MNRDICEITCINREKVSNVQKSLFEQNPLEVVYGITVFVNIVVASSYFISLLNLYLIHSNPQFNRS